MQTTRLLGAGFWAALLIAPTATGHAGVEPSPFHGASNRLLLPHADPLLKAHQVRFTMAQPVAGFAAQSHGSNREVAATTVPSRAGIGFEYAVRGLAICQCDCHGDPAGCDGVVDVLDVVQTINVAFRGGGAIPDPSGSCVYETTDTNCSAATDVIDVVRMVNVAFRGGDQAAEFCRPCGP